MSCFVVQTLQPSGTILEIESCAGQITNNLTVEQTTQYSLSISQCVAPLPADINDTIIGQINSHLIAGSGIRIVSNTEQLIISTTGLQPSGNYSLVGHTHTTSNITDFNNSVSSLLPVKNIIAGSNISVVDSSGIFTVAVTGQLGLTGEQVDDRVSNLLVGVSGIVLSYNDSLDTLTIGTSGLQPSGNYANTIHSHTSSDITNFSSSVSGLLPITSLSAGSGISIQNIGPEYTIGVTGSFGLTGEQVDDRVNSLLSAGSGISLSYNDNNDLLIISTSGNYTSVGHTHIIADVSGLQLALDSKQPSGSYAPLVHNHLASNITDFNNAVSGLLISYALLNSPNFSGVPTVPTAASGTNTTQIANTAFVRTEISNLIDAAPSTLDTLNELAAALGDDANFSTTITNLIGNKVSKSGDTMTGTLYAPSGNFTNLSVSGGTFQLYNNSPTVCPFVLNIPNQNDDVGAFKILGSDPDIFLDSTAPGSGYPSSITHLQNGQFKIAAGYSPWTDRYFITRYHNASWYDNAFTISRASGIVNIGSDVESLGRYTGSLILAGGLGVAKSINASSGNFTDALKINNIDVSISGHTHNYSDIINFASGVEAAVDTLLVAGNYININYDNLNDTLTISATGLQPSGNYSVVGHTHTSSNITDFNSSVSGLLPVKNIVGSGYVNVSSSSGNYTVSVSGLQPSGNYSVVGHSHLSTDITDFNSSVSGLIPVKDILAGNGISVSGASGIYTIASTITAVDEADTLVTTVFNKTGSTIPKMSVVYINGGQGDQPTIQLAIANGEPGSSKTYGITAQAIDHMSTGKVVVEGALLGLNTDQFNPTAPTGDVNGTIVYLSPSVSGAITTTKPSAPDHLVSVGTIVRTHQNEGIIEVRIQNGFELQELHNVAISGVTSGQFLQYNGTGLWIPSSSGNFTSLSVNGTGVSLTGHTHTSSNITDFNSSVSGLFPNNIVTGIGLNGYVTKWTGINSVSSGIIYDDGTNIGLGTTVPSGRLHVIGSGIFSSGIALGTSTSAAGTVMGIAVSGTNTIPSLIFDTINSTHGFNNTNYSFRKNGSEQFNIDGNGNLNTVNGNIVCTATSATATAGVLSLNIIRRRLTSEGVSIAWGESISSTTKPGIDLSPIGGTHINNGILLRLSKDSAKTDVAMLINGSGHVGIGTSSPSSPLHVIGSGLFTSNLTANRLISSQSSGDEGGELLLTKPATNSSLSGNVTIDIYQNKLRFFESDGSNRGYYLDITEGSGGAARPIITKTLATFTALDNQPPASGFATLDTRNSIAVLDFDDTTEESAVFVGIIPDSASLGSGLSVRIHWMSTGATIGDCRWGVQFEKSNTALDSDSFDTATETQSTTNATNGIVTVTTVTCTSIDSLAAGDLFRVKIYRDSTDTVNDTLVGDAELVAVEIRSVL